MRPVPLALESAVRVTYVEVWERTAGGHLGTITFLIVNPWENKEGNMKKFLMVVVALGVWSCLPASANAVCDRGAAQVVRVTSNPTSPNLSHFSCPLRQGSPLPSRERDRVRGRRAVLQP